MQEESRQERRLKELQERALEKPALIARRNSLQEQRKVLFKREWELRSRMKEEAEDVTALKRRSLSSLAARIFGNYEEKLEKEEREAYAAAAKYQVVKRELEAADQDLERLNSHLHQLEEEETEYQKLLREKEARLREELPEAREELQAFDERENQLKSSRKELIEAISAGEACLEQAERLLDTLDNALSWGTADLFVGGMLTSLQKHNRLDDAQRQAEELQLRLQRFRTELADVRTFESVDLSIGQMTRFADIFFDNIITDLAVQRQIRDARVQSARIRENLCGAVMRLREKRSTAQRELEEWERRRQEWVLQRNVQQQKTPRGNR